MADDQDRPDEEPRIEGKNSIDSTSPPERPTDDELAAALEVVAREVAAQPVDPTAEFGARPEDAVTSAAVAMSHEVRGPMPASAELAGYARVDSELPRRIADGADEERRHRHAIERRQSTVVAATSLIGVSAGAVFVVGALVLAAYAIHEGSGIGAIAGIAGGLAPVVLALVNRARKQ